MSSARWLELEKDTRMTSKPKKLYWVEMKLSGNRIPWSRKTAGVRGGKRSSLKACQDSKAQILRADPNAQVKIYEAVVDWKEVE